MLRTLVEVVLGVHLGVNHMPLGWCLVLALRWLAVFARQSVGHSWLLCCSCQSRDVWYGTRRRK